MNFFVLVKETSPGFEAFKTNFQDFEHNTPPAIESANGNPAHSLKINCLISASFELILLYVPKSDLLTEDQLCVQLHLTVQLSTNHQE